MRRLVLLVVTSTCLIAVTAAIAATINGTNGNDTLRGTAKADVINGKAGSDTLYGGAGNDRLNGGAGKDKVFCGTGIDRVSADRLDVVAKDCEIVTRTPATPPKKPAPTPPAAPTPPPAPVQGTRQNPFPLGTEARNSSYALKVNTVTPDATAAVLAANQFNDPPAAGNQFYIANITVTYVAASPPSTTLLSVFVDFGVLGSANVLYQSFKQSCGVIPDDLDQFATVFTGGTLTGNICWEVPAAESGSLVFTNGTNFWALR